MVRSPIMWEELRFGEIWPDDSFYFNHGPYTSWKTKYIAGIFTVSIRGGDVTLPNLKWAIKSPPINQTGLIHRSLQHEYVTLWVNGTPKKVYYTFHTQILITSGVTIPVKSSPSDQHMPIRPREKIASWALNRNQHAFLGGNGNPSIASNIFVDTRSIKNW